MNTRLSIIIPLALSFLANAVQARVYEPKTGRWLSRDPAGYVAGPNLFAYGGLRPIEARDPAGLCASGGDLDKPGCAPDRVPPDVINPRIWDPWRKGGAPADMREACTEACKSGAFDARGYCLNGQPIICICRNAQLLIPNRDHPQDWLDGYRSCLYTYERNNFNLFIITCPSSPADYTGPTIDGDDYSTGWCSKVMNIYAISACVASIPCTTDQCRDLRCKEARYRNCVANAYRKLCLQPGSHETDPDIVNGLTDCKTHAKDEPCTLGVYQQ